MNYWNNNQQSMSMQQPQLPFDPINQQCDTVAVGPNMPPPWVPQVNTDQRLREFVPVIASVAVHEMQSKMAANSMRMFMFNQMARNRYQNEDFGNLIYFLTQGVLHLLMNSAESNPHNVISRMVPEWVAACAGLNLRRFPALINMLTPELVRGGEEAANAWMQLESVVQRMEQNMIASTQQNQQRQSVGGFGSSGGQGQRQVQQATGSMFNDGQVSSGGGNMFQNTPTWSGGPESKLERQARLQREAREAAAHERSEQANMSTSFGRNARMRQEREEEQARAQQQGQSVQQNQQRVSVQQPAAAQTVVTPVSLDQPDIEAREALKADTRITDVLYEDIVENDTSACEPRTSRVDVVEDAKPVEPAKLKWAPSKDQPYHPSWDYRVQAISYLRVKNDVIAVTRTLNLEEQEAMNEHEHSLGRIATEPRKIPAPKKREEVNNLDLTAIPKVKVTAEEGQGMACTEAEARLRAMLNAAIVNEEGLQPDEAHRTVNFVVEPLVTESPEVAAHYRAILREMMDTRTLIQLRDVMGKLNSPEELLLFHCVNTRLTAKINEVLAINLGLLDVHLDSFFDDIGDLNEALSANFGDIMAKALEKNQSEIIISSLMVVDESDAVNYTAAILGIDPGDQVPASVNERLESVVLLGSLYSHTQLGVQAYKLGVTVVTDKPMLLTAEMNPTLYAIIQELFQGEGTKGVLVNRYALLTSDGVTIQVARGYLNDSFLLRGL